MKVLTAAEMRRVDRLTMERGIPEPILMENAGHRVVEYLTKRWPDVAKERILVLCGKGNNGGDGFVVARQLFTRFKPASLHVAATHPDDDSDSLHMLLACGCPVYDSITQDMRGATLVIDALLGTGISGAARGIALEWIREINHGFPHAKVLAVDLPSGMDSDSGVSEGEVARADACVTFTGLKVCHALPPNCDACGEVTVGKIGSPDEYMADSLLHLTEPADFGRLLGPRKVDTNKGDYGHVLVVGGAEGKTGAAEMAGIAALRAGAGLTTVACSGGRFRNPELMTEALPSSWADLEPLTHRKRVIAIGPGLGMAGWAVSLVRETVTNAKEPLVIDADGLNALAGYEWQAGDRVRVLTPHPGEMSRLLGVPIAKIQESRVDSARAFAQRTGAIVVLKGYRTVVARPDGRCWINATGSPALAKGGTGDVLTGLIAGMLAQYPDDNYDAIMGAVYLHGLAGQHAAADKFDKCVLATEILDYLPEAMRECARVSHNL